METDTDTAVEEHTAAETAAEAEPVAAPPPPPEAEAAAEEQVVEDAAAEDLQGTAVVERYAASEILDAAALMSRGQSELLIAAARMPERVRSELGLADFYNEAVNQGFSPELAERARASEATAATSEEPTNAANESVEVRIEGFIWEYSGWQLRDKTKNAKTVTVRINSPGGLAFSAYGIYDYLRQLSRKGINVTTCVEGRCASAGALIFMGGDRREMPRDMARLMFHRARSMLLIFGMGEASALQAIDVEKKKRNTVRPLEAIDQDIAAMMQRRTKMSGKDVAKMLDEGDTWYNAEEAMKRGIVTAYIEDKPKPKPKAKAKSGPKAAAKTQPKEEESKSESAGGEEKPENPGEHPRPERDMVAFDVLRSIVLGPKQ